MDAAGDMPDGWAEEYDIAVIPINIHFRENTYLAGVDLSNEGFYQLVDQSGVIPKTSQPTPQQFVDFYKAIADPGDTILSIHITGRLSGTYESAELAKRELNEVFNIYPVDSLNGSAGMGYMCRDARVMERAGRSFEEIHARMDEIRRNISINLVLDTLEYARMSGRVKTLQAAIASLLNVKPLVELRDGDLVMADKVRTSKKALQKTIAKVKEIHRGQKLNVAVVHARDPISGARLMEIVKSELDCAELIMTELSISVAANLGPGTLGIIAYQVAY
jgi:DegV family protein with EDD domain